MYCTLHTSTLRSSPKRSLMKRMKGSPFHPFYFLTVATTFNNKIWHVTFLSTLMAIVPIFRAFTVIHHLPWPTIRYEVVANSIKKNINRNELFICWSPAFSEHVSAAAESNVSNRSSTAFANRQNIHVSMATTIFEKFYILKDHNCILVLRSILTWLGGTCRREWIDYAFTSVLQ